MKICRYNDDRLGVVEEDRIRDVTGALDVLPDYRWPFPQGDQMIAHFDAVKAEIEKLLPGARSVPAADVVLKSPVANPSKIIGAPINYQKHIDEAETDDGIVSSRPTSHISDWGMFLKANSSLVGPGEGVELRFTEARNDHEVELAVIIGTACSNIPMDQAQDHILGYAIGLDMVTRGKELQSFRKSPDTYSVLGPWLVTKDEIPDPNNLDIKISVNGEERQNANTRDLVYNVERLVEYCAERYTLHPGDIIMTGTPEGVGPVRPGDVMHAVLEGVGEMDVKVR